MKRSKTILFARSFGILILILNFCPAFAKAENLSPAGRIELVAGKSFLFKSEKKIERVSVAKPEIADIKVIGPKQALINGVEPGTTNIIVWYAGGEIEVYDVTVNLDISIMEKGLKELVPETDIRVGALSGGVALHGEAMDQETMDRALKLVQAFMGTGGDVCNLIRLTGAQQVQLEVKVVEVSRTAMRRLGLSFLSLASDWIIGVFQVGEAAGEAAGGSGIAEIAGASASGIGSTTGIGPSFGEAFQVVVHSLDDDILSIISVLKGQGFARILARPTLVAMSGQKASFSVGGEFPIPVAESMGFGGGSAITVEFKDYGIMLEFTPTVIGRERIVLSVSTTVSQIDYSAGVKTAGAACPGIKGRSASTTLELKDGQTFAIAGLLEENIRSVIHKIPILGDIPILGALFSSKEYIKNETELIILVTPRLVKPMNPEDVPLLPGEGKDYNPTDFEFFLLGRFEHKEDSRLTESIKEDGPGFSGPMGFAR